MSESDLATWIAAVLFAAVLLGWWLRGLWHWLRVATGPERARLAALTEDLHRSEARREAAERRLAAAQARLRALENGTQEPLPLTRRADDAPRTPDNAAGDRRS